MSRISAGTLIVFIFALLVGLGGAYALRMYLAAQEPPPEEPPEQRAITVPVAALDLPAGHIIKRGDIAVMRRTELRGAPFGTILNPDDLINRVLSNDTEAGGYFVTTSLYPVGKYPALKIPAGQLAVTIPINDMGALAGFIGPGNLVDVRFRSNAGPGPVGYEDIPQKTITLVEGAQVLAVGRLGDGARDSQPRRGNQPETTPVTLAVWREGDFRIRAAMGNGDIYLSLNSTGAGGPGGVGSEDPDATLLEMLGVAKKPPPKRPKILVTEFFGGGRSTGRQVFIDGRKTDDSASASAAGNGQDAVLPPAGVAKESKEPPAKKAAANGAAKGKKVEEKTQGDRPGKK